MIRFSLLCANDHEFEGWFRDNAAFDQQARDRAIACPVCGDDRVRKAVMAPAVARSREAPAPRPAGSPGPEEVAKLIKMLRTIQEYVERHFENVGEQFPEEARKIDYGEAEERGIYGQASPQEVRELLEEGIAVRPLPMAPKLDG